MSHFRPIVAVFAALILVAGCQTEPSTPVARDNLQDDAQAALKRFERSDHSVREVLDRAAGYAVFPDIGKGGFVAGGAYGKGVLYKAGKFDGYVDISEATLGLQAGGQSFSELIIIQTPEALEKFKSGTYGLSGEASVVALKPGAAAQAEFRKGVMVFTLTGSGLMAEAAVAGQKFRYSSSAEVEQKSSNTRSDAGTSNTGADHNISASGSVSTPNGGDKSASGTANVGVSGSTSSPNGDHAVTTEKTVTTEKDTTTK